LPYYARRTTSASRPIRGFACAETERLFQTGKSRRFGNILAVAVRKLDMLNAAATLADLRLPPGNQLEALGGDRAGQHSIRISRQWRVCFVWTPAGPDRVEIVDYH
jgi:proteic killer suppression protein